MKKRRRRRQGSIGWLLVAPSLAGVTAFYLVPFLHSVFLTFTQGVHTKRFVGLAHFRALLANRVFLQAVANTGRFLLLGVPLLLGCALGLALVTVKKRFGWQRWALLLPMVLPVPSLCVAWRGVWGAGGLLPRPGDDWLQTAALPLLLALYLVKNIGYLHILLHNALQALPADYAECYRLDSDSELGWVRRVALPLLAPTLVFCCVAAVTNYFLLFRDVYMLYGDHPPSEIYMLQHFMNANFYGLNFQRLSAAAFLTVLALGGLTAAALALQRQVKRHVE